MYLKSLELNGFKSFAHKSEFIFDVPIIAIVGPNGSGKSNVVEAIRFVLGEQSVKSMRGKIGSDLIFKGSKEIGKKSRARVTITFDNHERMFSLNQSDNTTINVDFDEVTISREVFSDGTSSYKINGTEVRMKDVHELIASINIGSSGHHIISQGEADRYLNANAKDRRTLIEEALGLKVYQYRLKESLRKLERAQENLRETEMLRRELAPHLKFLKRQVEKIERAKELRTQLHTAYQTYFQQENLHINQIREGISTEVTEIQSQLDTVSEKLTDIQPSQEKVYPQEEELQEHTERMSSLHRERQEVSRELGRIEGMVSVLNERPPQQTQQYSREQVAQLRERITTYIKDVEATDQSSVTRFLIQLQEELSRFLNEDGDQTTVSHQEETRARLDEEKEALEKRITEITQAEQEIQETITRLNKELEEERRKEQEEQRSYYETAARRKELMAKLTFLEERKRSLAHREEDREKELTEARTLLGTTDFMVQEQLEQIDIVSDEEQARYIREIERMKIRLEDIGGGSGTEVLKEYEDTVERDTFLAQEMEDVANSITSLEEIIDELSDTLNREFSAGVEKINVQFNSFFKLMFGGGEAELKSVLLGKRNTDSEGTLLEEEKKEYGIDIAVRLPRKKVSDLDMLSGGERSLTSIALLFALSQVNPPPFLVLDETDAALDEANSQKYGDMIESLSKVSQLILVTHNRETMSRAQTLFGVTLGRDDASTMLSLRLEDAEKYAK